VSKWAIETASATALTVRVSTVGVGVAGGDADQLNRVTGIPASQ
jgi:hypothetical protein